MLANANFNNTPLSFVNIRNTHSDFDQEWYENVGQQIVFTIILQIFMPYVQFFVAWFTKFAFRFLDSKCSVYAKIPNTKCITIQQYVNTYAGPEATLHFRYSQILNLIMITMTYGTAMPLLYPIAFFALVNFYVCERIQFAYFYRKAPLMGNLLNQTALNILSYAPFFGLSFSYWFMGNR